MPVEADHVYLIPPKKEMIISGGRLLLSERDRQQELTLPIDVFFRSLAQDCGRARRRHRALRRRQRRLARHPRRARRGRARPRPGRRERAVRRHAARRARHGRRRPRAAARGDAARARRARRTRAGGASGPRRRGRGGDRPRRRVPDAAGGVRHRLHALQAEHGHAAHRAAPGARPVAEHRRVRADGSGRSATSSTRCTTTC